MEFKIDTKPTYTVITPEISGLSVKMAEDMLLKAEEVLQDDGKNIIFDLNNISQMELSAGDTLLTMHHKLYEAECSLVFTGLTDAVMQTLKQGQYHLSLNLTPTMIEAIDIISMESLERDLLGEM